MSVQSPTRVAVTPRTRHDAPRENPPAPLLPCTLALLAGVWLSDCVGSSAAVRWCGFIVAACVLLPLAACHGRLRRVASGLALVAFFATGVLRHQVLVWPAPHHVSRVAGAEPLLTRVAGELVTTPSVASPERRNAFLPHTPAPRTRFVLAARALCTTSPPAPLCGRIQVTVSGDVAHLQPGATIELTGWLSTPRPPRNPGEFDWARWQQRQGIDAVLRVDGPGYIRHGLGEPSFMQHVSGSLRRLARMLLLEPQADAPADDACQLLDTMVLGQRGAADRRLNEAFARAGGLHFLAVSGFNVSVLAGASWVLVRRVLRRSPRTTALFTLVLILLFALVAEPNAPIVRATIAGVLAAVTVCTRRPVNLLNWLAAAALGIVMFNPLELFRAGFQLSFVQVLALLLLVPWLQRQFGRSKRDDDPDVPWETPTWSRWILRSAARGVLGLVLVSTVAWAISLPLTCYHFGRLAPWGALGTLLLAVPVTLMIWMSLLTLLARALMPPLGDLLDIILKSGADLLLRLVGLFELLPGSMLEVNPPPWWAVFATYAILLWVTTRRGAGNGESRLRQRLRFPALVGGALAVLWSSVLVYPAQRDDAVVLDVLAVGDGAALLAVTPQGAVALFDAGTDRNSDVAATVTRALATKGLSRLDWAFISHANHDHYSGYPELLRQGRITRLSANAGLLRPDDRAAERLAAALPPDIPPLESIAAGSVLTIGALQIEVLWPPAELETGRWSWNDRSLVARLSCEGRSVLVTGDIERSALRELLAADRAGTLSLAADVLIAPHHGAVVPETGAFLRAVNPQVVIASCAEPRPRLASLLRQELPAGRRLLATAEDGTIRIKLGPAGALRVATPFRRASGVPR